MIAHQFYLKYNNEILCLYLFPITTSYRHAFHAFIKCLATILEKNVLSRPNMEWLTISNILLYERGQKMLEWKCFMYQYFSKTRKTTIINTICGPERVILFGYLMQESKGGGSKKVVVVNYLGCAYFMCKMQSTFLWKIFVRHIYVAHFWL